MIGSTTNERHARFMSIDAPIRPAEPVGTLDVALAHASKLLEQDPDAAAEQALEILKASPDHPLAMLYLAVARRFCGDPAAATKILEPLCRRQPQWAAVFYELGMSLGLEGRGEAAIVALRRAVELKSDHANAWRALGDHLTTIGDSGGADQAYARHIRHSTRDPRLMQAALALCEQRIAPAEALLREHLQQYPTDVAAIRMLAEVAGRLGRYADAENLLARCLELAPSFTSARHNYALVLHRQNQPARALAEVEVLLKAEPRNPGYRNLKAAVLTRIGEYRQSIDLYSQVLREYPNQAKVWMSYGHALKTAGRQAEAIKAYQKSIDLAPELGEAYWSLANLKTFRFAEQAIEAMAQQLQRAELAVEDRFHFCFALGKALEDAGDFAASFAHYSAGNRLRRAGIRYDADETTAHVRRSRTLLTREFFESRQDYGHPAEDPIFIVGLPRAGSTLLEQILSSHPDVEGTMELPDLLSIAKALGGRKTRERGSNYPEILATLTADECRALGEQYLAATRIQRKTAARFFIDKMPNNFAHIGLIQMILPRATIIDARRHPLACCFSGFKQHFAHGQLFSYDQEDIGRYYADYIELLAHYESVLPGRVRRVFYETMIEDTELEVRRLLQHCRLPFDARCLRFFENGRAVRTASSEQVRQPIFRDSLDQWRRYEPWLEPLKATLGGLVDSYTLVRQANQQSANS
jgi:predicted Zn-dependent protease